MKLGMQTRLARGQKGELLAWDTEFWNVKIGRGHSPDLDRWAEENMVGCMWILIGADDQAAIHRAEANGAQMMDIRVELARSTGAEATVSRPVSPGDMDALAAISRTAFRGLTRFYADPLLPDERCDDLYENWLRTSPGWAAEILMVEDGDGPIGFVTIHVEDDEASIGLIAVEERARGEGVGENLTKAAVDWAHEQRLPRIKVVTQGCNIPAQRAFQHAGFRISKTDVWLHQWL